MSLNSNFQITTFNSNIFADVYLLDPLTHNTSTLNTVTHHDCRQWELNEMARGYQLKPKGIFLFCSK